MGEVLKLPRRKKAAKKTNRAKVLAGAVGDPCLRSVLLSLYDNDLRLHRMAERSLKAIFQRLDALEALVFSQSVLIAELRGQPLSPEQQSIIAKLLGSNREKLQQEEN